MKTYSAIIIDDEINNLVLLKHFIKKFCLTIEIVGEADSVSSGIDIINARKPKILFLDIKLNDSDVYEILDEIDFTEYEIVFVTAYDEFALKAFKYNAVDYVLKPVLIEDLVLAVNKCITRIEEKERFENHLEDGYKKETLTNSKYISVASMDKVDIIKKDDLVFCKSDGRYTTFFMKNKEEIVACKNIGEYESILVDDNFFRIHHSYIINLDHVVNINKKSGYYCEMINGALLPIAKRRQDSLNRFLKIKD
ncbi:LytR/AlgR family response regulator transcription factor [Flavobacterium lacisediminis]|uniref:LytTR family DNA-binding domain-containing protein n=1 Tax=Flavobacterium lacisediminis TaxID=2989705 RepID=A0ABT3EKF7_9FLAO|nr:LytTR family DNA-binding domain-containing protein [Flavobacterium lacisediminis]MCW1148619.1 LytTR family DNA-binding domain-containing protein [Flavobacterium lacisediminis]